MTGRTRILSRASIGARNVIKGTARDNNHIAFCPAATLQVVGARLNPVRARRWRYAARQSRSTQPATL